MTTTRLPQEVKTFVRRGSRMTTSQRHWLDRHGPAYLVDVRREARVTSIPPQPPLDLAAVFGRGTAPLVVEIGSGHGETLAFAAERHPDWDFLGFEVFDAALASTLGKLAPADLRNVRLVAGDGLEGLEHLLPPAAIMELWLFFPDPWHKSRHHKRRLVSQSFADLAASRLRPGGVLRLATDWDDYAAWTRAVLDPHPAFERLDAGRCPDRPETKFEARGRAAGRTIHDLAYVRRRA